jgi:antitoxin FitA
MAMTAISVRNLDPEVKAKLRVRAAEHGRSMEAEIRAILVDAVSELSRPVGLFDAIRAISLDHGGVELELPHRERRQRPIDLS